jgi:GT2 family glycosyltransferase
LEDWSTKMSNILIQCVVVLYKCAPDDSKTLLSLEEICRQYRGLSKRIALLIYDNSPDPQAANLDRWHLGAIEYHHSSENGGLASAYNQALSKAVGADIKWLLLLDQDTVLTPALFPALFETIESPLTPEICAIVPKLARQGEMLSPQIVGRFHNRDVPTAFWGTYRGQITALNSAACVRTQALIAIGGFPREYWLDYLDHIIFHRLQAAGGRVLVLNIVVEHSLSLRNLEAEMSLDRYANVLSAEWRFVRETGSGGGPLVHRLRLLKRALTHAIKLRNNAYAIRTLRAVLE